MIEVFLEGLEFYAYHGVPAAEREIGHRYRVDLTMTVDSKAESTDSIEDTVDYGKVGAWVVRFGENNQWKTLEHMASQIASGVMESNDRIASVLVSVRKMLPPAPFIAEACGVTLELTR